MEIEKINDNQIRITLSRSDLNERDIDLIELLNGSEKTHQLLREMMEQALIEHDFQATDSPIIIEAAPLSQDSITLVITKMNDDSLLGDNNFDFDKGMALLSEIAKRSGARRRSTAGRREAKKPEELRTIFSFASLDSVMDASARLYNTFWGDSFLTKEGSKYYLMLTNNQNFERVPIKQIDAILAEYGEKQAFNTLTEQYLKEHGEIIINEQATIKLAEYLYN